MPFYNKGRVVVLGDAGHASESMRYYGAIVDCEANAVDKASPHHGAGAGMCIESAAVMAELLADPRVAENGSKGITAAFAAL